MRIPIYASIELKCKFCATIQYVSLCTYGGSLNRERVRQMARHEGTKHLWYINKGMSQMICPVCVPIRKPRAADSKIIIKEDCKMSRDIDSYGSSNSMPLLWKPEIVISQIGVSRNGIEIVVYGGGRKYKDHTGTQKTADIEHLVSVNFADLLDPLIREQALHLSSSKEQKKDTQVLIQEILDDHRSYIRLVTEGKILPKTKTLKTMLVEEN